MADKLTKKIKFSNEDEEKMIDFVKSNEILFNVKHTKFRDSEAKNRLWLSLAKELNKDVEMVKKKWTTMRDYFISKQQKKTTGSAAATKKRDESMSFLVHTSIMNRPTISSLPSTSTTGTADAAEVAETFEEQDSNSEAEYDTKLCDINSVASDFNSVLSTGTKTPTSKKRKADESSELLREFLANRPNPSDFIPQKPVDDVQYFLDSIGVTMRRLSPLAIARIKIKIANIVGEEEIAWAEQNPAGLDWESRMMQHLRSNFLYHRVVDGKETESTENIL